jgi:hypothetical protein
MPLWESLERRELLDLKTLVDHLVRLPIDELGAMKRNVIRRVEARDGGVWSVERALQIIETRSELAARTSL